VAAWLSVTVLRGRGPEGGGFFQGRNLRRAMDVCVCLSGADGRVVEGRASDTLPTTTARSAGFKSRPDGPPMNVVLCSYCVVQKGEMRGEGGRGWPGKVPRRRRKKQLADRKVPDRPGVVKGEGYKKNKLYHVR
jgi:hypothetical protein